MALRGDAVAWLQAADLAAALDDLAAELVTDGEGYRNCLPGPVVPLEYVYVGSADCAATHPDQHIVMTDFGFADLLEPDPALGSGFDQCFHR